jgi:hypothetical protein
MQRSLEDRGTRDWQADLQRDLEREATATLRRAADEIRALHVDTPAPGTLCLSDDAWQDLAAKLPCSPAERDQWRVGIDLELFLFAECRPAGHGCCWVEDEAGRKRQVRIVEQHERIAHAAREFIAAHKHIVICEDEIEERDRLLEKVDQIAQRSEDILRSDNYKRNIGRGRRKDASLDRLVNGLIRTWRVAGGRVGGGTSGNDAGPLIRFLKHATALVLPSEPGNEAVRHWVRSYKRSRGGNKSP